MSGNSSVSGGWLPPLMPVVKQREASHNYWNGNGGVGGSANPVALQLRG
ncbi:MAG: hypothetical protein ACLQU3_08390 [Limisphaerales bacterium]